MAMPWQGARKKKQMKMKEMNGARRAAGMDAIAVILIVKFEMSTRWREDDNGGARGWQWDINKAQMWK